MRHAIYYIQSAPDSDTRHKMSRLLAVLSLAGSALAYTDRGILKLDNT